MVDIERYLGSYLGMLVHSYNPDRYVALMEESWRKYVKFFVLTTGITLVLFILTFLPLAFQYISILPETLQTVESFNLSASIEADHPVVILGRPEIVLDMNATSYGQDILFTREGMYYPAYVLFGEGFVPWSDMSDLKRSTPERDRLLLGILLFILPSIIFWFAFVSILKLFLAFLGLLILGYYGPRFLGRRMRFSETVKLAILALPSVMFIGVGLSPLAPTPLFWWGLCLTLVLFVIGIALLSERVAHERKHAKV